MHINAHNSMYGRINIYEEHLFIYLFNLLSFSKCVCKYFLGNKPELKHSPGYQHSSVLTIARMTQIIKSVSTLLNEAYTKMLND